MGAILDLSSVGDASSSVDEAQSLVAKVCRDGLMFEFQLASS
jgi:ribonuclease HII